MHEVVEEILQSTRTQLDSLEAGFEGPVLRPRDLVEKAKSQRSRGISPIIAEIKPRILGRSLKPEEVSCYAELYEQMGASAISVLTQQVYFDGSLNNLKIAREATSLPLLRKDFILDERQLGEAKADLVLLIATFSNPLEGLIDAARSRGMEPLVEVHTEYELDLALKTDARILGINNRNLRSLEIDLGTFERLGPIAKDSGLFVVAESGVKTREDVLRMEEAGADALLVGTSLMEEPTLLLELNGIEC